MTSTRWNAPSGYTMRAAERTDLPAVARLARLIDEHDYGESSFDLDFIAGDWDRPEFDPASDAWVVKADEVVGFGQALDEAPGVVETLGLVHPDHRARGIGAALVEAGERRAAELGARAGRKPVKIQAPVAAPDSAARDLLTTRGYGMVRSFFHMQVDLAPPGGPQPEPDGIALRDYVPDRHERSAHATIEAAFAGTWGFHPLTYEQFRGRVVGNEFEPGLSVVAMRREDMVGVLLGRTMNGLGWVDMLAVLPEWRGRGIGAGLLRASFDRFRDRGLPLALLNVDSENEAGAVRLYEGVGMRVRRRWDLYEKEIPPPA